MALPVNKTFVGSGDVATNDSDFSQVLGSITISSNAYRGANSGPSSYRINTETFPDDQYSQGTFSNTGSGNFTGVSVRNQSGAATYYALNGSGSSGTDTFLVEVTAGSQSVLDSGDGDDWANDVVIRLEIEGTTLTPLNNGSTPGGIDATTIDASITSGDAGIAGFNSSSSNRIDAAEFGGLGTPPITADGALTLAPLTMAGTAVINAIGLTANGALSLPALTMAGTATLNAVSLDANGALSLPAITMSGDFVDNFDGSGDLADHWSQYQESDLPDITQTAGRYRANLTNNASDITLWFNDDEGRGDYITKTGEFELIATNIGIGTQGDSQDAPPNTGSTILFCGINIWDSSGNSAHIVVGHRGGSANHTVENKGTIAGSSTVTDEGTNAAPLGRMDLRIVKNSSNVCEISYRAPGSSDSWTLSNSDGTFPSPPTFGATVRVQLITYAQGTAGVPFVGTCDRIEFIGENPSTAILSRKVLATNLDLPALTMSGSATLNAAPLTSSGALDIPALTLSGTATLNKNASGDLDLPAITLSGSATLKKNANSAIDLTALELSGSATLSKKANGSLDLPAITLSGSAGLSRKANSSIDLPAITMSASATLNKKVLASNLDLPALTMSGSATLNTSLLIASGALALPALQMSGTATLNAGPLSADGELNLPALTMQGSAVLNHKANGAIILTSLTMSAVAISSAAIPLITATLTADKDTTLGADKTTALTANLGEL